jgi:hypothetical protein
VSDSDVRSELPFNWRAMLLVALVVFLVHASFWSDWLIDDAGISLAYARNLALGHGLVSQPGVVPVEGYSNPVWTIALAPLFWTSLPVVPWAIKVVSLLLVAAVFVLLGRRAVSWPQGLPPLFLALSTPFVVWTTSGLENPLLALLLVVSAVLSLAALDRPGSVRLAAASGAVAGLLALTRPDGIVYAAACPFVLLIAARLGVFLRRVLVFGGILAAVVLPYEVFRWFYFGDLVPNTFHAKVRPWLLAVDPARLWELTVSTVGLLAPLAVALIVASILLRWRAQSEVRRLLVLGFYLALASTIYLLLPPDWMGEYRFATGFLIFFYWLFAESLSVLWKAAAPRPFARWALAGVALLFVLRCADVYASRSADFAHRPTVPFARIAEFGRGYDELAGRVRATSPSLLAPDLGGTLFEARRLRVYDLAGLCDRTVARTLMSDTSAFHDYVFDSAQPTFIHVHGTWAGWAALHKDARFARDYVALHEVWERPAGATDDTGGEPWVGDYVRREALAMTDDLERVRREFVDLGLGRALP